MLFQLLEGEAAKPATPSWVSYVLIGVMVVILVGSMIFMNRRSKKRDQEAQERIDAVKPGNKVKTVGGVCGIVVEVNKEEDTFVLETGTEEHGKCYMKFLRQAIMDSDAVVVKADKTEKIGAKEISENTEKAEETEETPVAETEPVKEEVAETKPEKVEEPAKKQKN